jgi:flagellar hook-length control protein FliK
MAEHAAASGGKLELLALLFGGEGDAEAPAFPATLQAALAGGGATDESLDAADAVGTDDDTTSEDENGTSLDAALAAALGLGVVATPQVPKETDAASGEESPLDPQVIEVRGDSQRVEVCASGGAATGQPGIAGAPGAKTAAASVDVAVAAGAAIVDSQQGASATPALAAADEAAVTIVRPSPNPSAGGRSVGGEVQPPSPATATASAAGSAQLGAVANAVSTEIGAARPTPQTAHAGSASGSHHGVVAAGAVSAATSFGNGGSEQHGLDLGTSERQASALAGKPATALTTTTAPAYEGEKSPAPTAVTGSGAGAATTALPPATTSSSPQDGVTPRTPHTAQLPGGIEARWGERVADALRLSAVRGGGEIRLQLEPEGLGHIDVRLHLQSDGVRAVIVAEHESTRALLTSQQHVLQDAFNRSDLRLSGFSVDVGSGGGAATFGRGGEGDQGGSAPPSPTAPVVPVTSAEALDSTAAPLADGRVNVRV